MMSEKEILEAPTADQIHFWVGRLCVAIGRGDIRSTVWELITFYQKEAYERGLAAKKGTKK